MLEGNFLKASGVILYREISGEKNLWLKLFLKEFGLVNVTARRSNGDTEPFIWGKFELKKKKNSVNYYVNEIEVFDDMLPIRERREAILTTLQWTRLIKKFLTTEQADDDLLANLYWSMKLLEEPRVPIEVSNWKFLWRWLESWGLAPDLVNFYSSQKFNHDEIILLTQISLLNVKGVIDLFSKKLNPNIRENSLKIAAKLAEKFLIEK
ncbi:MAG: hypothetical protein IJ859_08750 [Synergistaceae bacterium]|nr:hypothetical protein [Synergistaceae bacterium]